MSTARRVADSPASPLVVSSTPRSRRRRAAGPRARPTRRRRSPAGGLERPGERRRAGGRGRAPPRQHRTRRPDLRDPRNARGHTAAALEHRLKLPDQRVRLPQCGRDGNGVMGELAAREVRLQQEQADARQAGVRHRWERPWTYPLAVANLDPVARRRHREAVPLAKHTQLVGRHRVTDAQLLSRQVPQLAVELLADRTTGSTRSFRTAAGSAGLVAEVRFSRIAVPGGSAAPAYVGSCMRLISWNMAGRVRCLDAQVEAIGDQRPDAVALQEVTAKTAPLLQERLTRGGLIHSADSFGLCGDTSLLNGPKRHRQLVACRWPILPVTPDRLRRPMARAGAIGRDRQPPWAGGATHCGNTAGL